MEDNVWLSLNEEEQEILNEALSLYSHVAKNRSVTLDVLRKVTHAKRHPCITVGVYGGLVQWILGNPFPIRICDYDGETDDLPDIDEQGQRCSIWFEPVDASCNRS